MRSSGGTGQADEDADLVRAIIRSGSVELFERLVERHQRRVLALVAAILGPRLASEAEDVTQEVLVLAFSRLGSFRMECRFSTWLYRIASNKAIEWKRQARHRHAHTSTDGLAEALRTPPESSPLSQVLQSERRLRVLELAESLPEPHRTAVLLYYWLDCPVSEIAAALGARPGTVKSYLFRARQRLAQQMKREEIDVQEL
jgi:RNA polymerase sigma-70 factor (ECF subfamily)